MQVSGLSFINAIYLYSLLLIYMLSLSLTRSNRQHGVKYVIGIKSASTHAVVRNLMRNGWMTSFGSLWEAYHICAAFIIGNFVVVHLCTE